MKLLALRALADADLKLLHRWLNNAHLRPFYMREPVSFDHVTRKFLPRIGSAHACHCLIAEKDSVPFGYAQWYLNRDFPDYGAAIIGKSFGVSIDYFIGNVDYLGRRLGSKMLRALVSDVAPHLDADDRVFYVGHDDNNERAVRCTTLAGFVASESYRDGSAKCTLYIRDETER